MIIAVLNTKGGVGKTTTALNLIATRAMAGREVLAVDGAVQGSLITAMANRIDSTIAVAQYTDGQTMRQQVTIARPKYDDIVIDGGQDSSAMRAAILLADLVLIPFQPRSFDVWALDDIAKLLNEARATKDINALAFLCMADPRGTDNAEAAGAVPPGIIYLDKSIGRRKAIADAAGKGCGVLESKDAKTKAGQEVLALVTAVFNHN